MMCNLIKEIKNYICFFLINHRKFKYKSKIGKILYILIDLPFTILRDLTIPACDKFKFKRNILVFNVILSPIFIVLITKRNIYFFILQRNWIHYKFTFLLSYWYRFNYDYIYIDNMYDGLFK
jgi:hypothetical protein